MCSVIGGTSHLVCSLLVVLWFRLNIVEGLHNVSALSIISPCNVWFGLDMNSWQQGKEGLVSSLESTDDVKSFFDPGSVLIDNTYYENNFPAPADYRIMIAVDPCRYLAYNCCMNVFGTPEYPALIDDGLEAERKVKYTVLGDETAVQINYQAVFEDQSVIPSTALRMADDNAVIDYSCKAKGSPYSYCYGKNYAFQRSPSRPNCSDNNVTLNVLAGCLSPVGKVANVDMRPSNGYGMSDSSDGSHHKHCVQVGYSQNAFIGQCQGNEEVLGQCGTYLEIHMVQGSPYQSEDAVIAEVRLETRNVSGMYTTMLPLNWMGNTSRVLCSYTETFFRIGSIVYVKPSAPTCCCPKPSTPSDFTGSFFCPKGASGAGPTAAQSQTIADKLLVDSNQLTFPFCHSGLDANDRCTISWFVVI